MDWWRAEQPGIRILVHPECKMEVVDKADLVGSTEYIVRTRVRRRAGVKWAVGTEVHLVSRLASAPRRKSTFSLPTVCMCSTMYRIDPASRWALENLRGNVVNRISVPETARWARLALQRMLEVH